MSATGTVEVERLGGLGGFGQPGGHLRSRGELPLTQLSAADRKTVDALLASQDGPPATMPDGFRYRITRHQGGAAHSVEVTEAQVPAALRDCVRDELI